MLMFALPRWIKRVYVWCLRHIRKDEVYAGLVENWYEKTVEEYLALIARREEYRAQWFDMWPWILCLQCRMRCQLSPTAE